MAKRGGGGRHCERERSNPRFAFHRHEDCFVAALLAMTSNLFARSRPLHHAAHGPPPPRRCARGGGRNGGAAPRERWVLPRAPSAADLKFLHRLRHARLGTSNRKAALEIIYLLVPLCFRSSCQTVPPRITNFGSGALMSRIPSSREYAATWFA